MLKFTISTLQGLSLKIRYKRSGKTSHFQIPLGMGFFFKLLEKAWKVPDNKISSYTIGMFVYSENRFGGVGWIFWLQHIFSEKL